MLQFLKQTFSTLFSTISSKFTQIFSQSQVDQHTIDEVEKILLSADIGMKMTHTIIASIKAQLAKKELSGPELQQILAHQLTQSLSTAAIKPEADIFLLVGINGSGKTTAVSKLAARLKKQHKKIMLVAGDTFRAAATHQLVEWGNRLGVPVIQGTPNQDPSAVVYTGCNRFVSEEYDVLIIDTAGRLQTKVNLMKELEKIKKTIAKAAPGKTICTLLTIDAMLGQNSFEQARLFHESTHLDGIIVTKLDGSARGGIIFSIFNQLHIPIAYITFGEQPEDIEPFDPSIYTNRLLGIE